MQMADRLERDLIGEKLVPGHAYWGIHTARALENFPITGIPISAIPELVHAFALVKTAAAKANRALGVLGQEQCDAICQACDMLRQGRFREQFVVDVIQGGAGTSTNMNVNEVIANLGLEWMGHPKGSYDVLHPNDHVNASQSTNDAYPTALRMALWMATGPLLAAMADLRKSFEHKALEFRTVLKIGRTQLQDAVPVSLGRELGVHAAMLQQGESRLREARALLEEVNLGATAVGTGINAPPGYSALVCAMLAKDASIPVRTSDDLMAATQDTGAFVHLSSVLKGIAIKLSKTCSDLRLLASGPQAGFGDISLPARQAGSSIMPGKVNPVMPEVVNQVAYEVIGNDLTVCMASEAGQLQLNAFEPIIGWSLFKSIKHLSAACGALDRQCIQDIGCDQELLARRVQESATLATALNPVLGYEKACLLAKRGVAECRPLAELAEELQLMKKDELLSLLEAACLAPAEPAPG